MMDAPSCTVHGWDFGSWKVATNSMNLQNALYGCRCHCNIKHSQGSGSRAEILGRYTDQMADCIPSVMSCGEDQTNQTCDRDSVARCAAVVQEEAFLSSRDSWGKEGTPCTTENQHAH
eukprot:4926126-Amphidinium_carterae.1